MVRGVEEIEILPRTTDPLSLSSTLSYPRAGDIPRPSMNNERSGAGRDDP